MVLYRMIQKHFVIILCFWGSEVPWTSEQGTVIVSASPSVCLSVLFNNIIYMLIFYISESVCIDGVVWDNN